ncbi:Glycosyl transferases group 1 [Pseudomonas pohangensis]|uniref:Glycosyl transferases group 1 n=1 Tax=Pseudomonas pohangensis TaxID=364197 RepID=A0A1H2EKT0_9PSED|nr:glycosyltransferase [Pseudomonas pohangensis]SDT95710.1 Glycosyl transferases group 1 [Pseudomonas pohangensis]
MLVTKQLQDSPAGGRELLCKLNHDALRDIYGDRLILLELPSQPLRGLKSAINAFKGHIDGLSQPIIEKALQTIQVGGVSKVFVDGSNLGAFVSAAKHRFPDVEVTTFFHNAEARFFWGALKQTKSLRALAVLVANYLAERKAVRYSDKIICLNERDSRLLGRLYGREATHLSAMALQDKLPLDLCLSPVVKREKFALFVGGVFYANRAGIAWFVKHVVPHINIKICIVGCGFEDLKPELERDGKVEVIGAVESLAQWYLDSHFVIAPIFDGSGMKTKVAEALMFGKKVVGTPEAFTGYEAITKQVGWTCTTADEFIAAIERANESITQSYDADMRAIYLEKYSYAAARLRISEAMDSVVLR